MKIFPPNQVNFMFDDAGPSEDLWIRHYWFRLLLVPYFTLKHILGPVSLTIFARNSNSMEISPCCNSVAGHQIATNFCTCHDSTAVAITVLESRWEWNEISIEFELRWKICKWNGALEQCWLNTYSTLGNKCQWDSNRSTQIAYKQTCLNKSSTKWQPFCITLKFK